MVWFKDEIVRESATVLSPTSMQLSGAVANHIRFRNAKRRDGNPVQSGDRCRVGVIQAGVGRGICSAVLTLGAEDTLTLDDSRVLQSTAGSGLPTFSNQGAAAEVYITSGVDDVLDVDEDGLLVRPEVVRFAVAPATVFEDFATEIGTLDREAVLALGAQAAFDNLAGFFAYDINSSTPKDDEDVFENINTNTGRIHRLNVKPWATYRNNTIDAGNVLQMFDAATASRRWLVDVWSTDGANRARALVTGHAADPLVDVDFEIGNLIFELVGTAVRIRNASDAAMPVRFIRPIIG